MKNDNSKLILKTMEEVMHESMIPYSEYVIMDRALPRVEDGLKPVQRRVLYSMYELGVTSDKPYKKSARIVGDCLGKYHPHGDTSIYGAMVRLAQTFNMGAVLVDGHGNFGSIDGDGAAAMRYTEARLSPLAEELLKDIEKDTVKWADNFDNTCKEPEYLPGKFPNLLVNGASGIAVGLATNIPPHNLAEAIDGVIAYINNPKITLKEMMKIIKGPDFPSGGVLIAEELEKAYETGKGRVIIRAKVHIEAENDKRHIIIDEIPYQVNKANLLQSILALKEKKKGGVLDGISDILDESDRNGIRGVIKLKKDANVNKILDELFKETNLQISYGINMVAIADGKPQQMGLIDIIAYYTDYQRSVMVRRTKFELEQAKERMHILEGLVIAVKNIDEVVKIIKGSKNTTEAKEKLKSRFSLSERQAQAIIDLKLGRLTSLEILKLENELEELRVLVNKLTAILGSKKLQFEKIIEELLAIKRKYKYPRKTEIIYDLKEYKMQSEEPEKMAEDCVVVVNGAYDIKKMTQKSFNMAQKDFSETSTIHEMCHIVKQIKTSESLFCFTNLGNCYKLQPEEIPVARWREKSTPINKVIKDILSNERIVYVLPMGEDTKSGDLLFLTKDGMVKRSPLIEYNIKKSSFQAAKLKEGDEIISIQQYKANCSLMFITKNGICLNSDMSDIPLQGRISSGVKGIKLEKDDECIAIGQVDKSYQIALISDSGLAKKVNASDIDIIGRYNKGVKIADLKKDSKLIFATFIKKDIKLVIETEEGFMQGFNTAAFSVENRTHAGRPLYRGKEKISKVYLYSDDFID